MDKALVNNVLTAVVTAGVLGVLGFFMGVFEKGAQAMNEDQITAVIEEVLVMDSGKTYKARMAELNIEIATMETRVTLLKTDVVDLEASLFDLVSD